MLTCSSCVLLHIYSPPCPFICWFVVILTHSCLCLWLSMCSCLPARIVLCPCCPDLFPWVPATGSPCLVLGPPKRLRLTSIWAQLYDALLGLLHLPGLAASSAANLLVDVKAVPVVFPSGLPLLRCSCRCITCASLPSGINLFCQTLVTQSTNESSFKSPDYIISFAALHGNGWSDSLIGSKGIQLLNVIYLKPVEIMRTDGLKKSIYHR